MSKKQSYMNQKKIFTENFITDFFKKMFKKGEKKVYQNFADNPAIAKKIKKTKAMMQSMEKDLNKQGFIWSPENGGWVDKKTGERYYKKMLRLKKK